MSGANLEPDARRTTRMVSWAKIISLHDVGRPASRLRAHQIGNNNNSSPSPAPQLAHYSAACLARVGQLELEIEFN